MFYRRKVILAMLQRFGGNLGKTQFQKLLLLFSKSQEKPVYHFVPYKYGCYSFQAMADVSTMQKYGQVNISNKGILKLDPVDYIALLKHNDRRSLHELFVCHGNKSYSDLIKYTYRNFPYYAINSEISDRYLSEEELIDVKQSKPERTGNILYTIGYEGITLEEYLNRLIINDVKVLVDVRNNPVSMKYGFTQSQLLKACTSVGIQYTHFPEVGVVSDQRRELKSQSDYDALFEKYKQDTIPHTVAIQKRILNLLVTNKRVALTCFEANICQCHRKHLAEAVTGLPNWNYSLIHL